MTLFDTADIYSDGRSEEVLGAAIKHLKREEVLISTKATFRLGKGPNDVGSSRYHLIQRWRGRCGGWGRITSTSTTCMSSTRDAGGRDVEHAGRDGARGEDAVHSRARIFRDGT